MALADLLAQNVLVRWLTGNRQRYDLAVSMTGIKLGERLLQIGCADARLLAALGAKVGFTGRTCGVDADAAIAARARDLVTRAGVLVEVEHASYDVLPFEAGAFDLVVVRPHAQALLDRLGPAFGEASRVLRPGGRLMVIAERGSLTARMAGAAARGTVPAAALSMLGSAGFRGARVLTEREHLVFVEGVKPRA